MYSLETHQQTAFVIYVADYMFGYYDNELATKTTKLVYLVIIKENKFICYQLQT